MQTSAYEFIVAISRYWFIIIVAYILFRIIQNARLEYRYEKSIKAKGIGAFLGIVTLIEDDRKKPCMEHFGLRRENYIGSSQRNADIVIEGDGLLKRHAVIYQKDEEVHIANFGTKETVWVGEDAVENHIRLYHGDLIWICGNTFKLALKKNQNNKIGTNKVDIKA